MDAVLPSLLIFVVCVVIGGFAYYERWLPFFATLIALGVVSSCTSTFAKPLCGEALMCETYGEVRP